MELYIRIKDGQPFEHPIIGENFRAAFPKVDVNNLPPEFARFERIAAPVLGPYEVYEGVTYELFGSVYRDFHHVRQMTEQEKTNKQDTVKALWAENGFGSWLFDVDTCSFISPVPYPDDGGHYRWDEPSLSWILLS
jgi:hypothetical protein